MNLRSTYLWGYIYDLIRSDLGFSYDHDYWSASIASIICDVEKVMKSEEILHRLINGRRVLVVGAADSCVKCAEVSKYFDSIVAADGATKCCLDQGVKPNVIVTDLDGLTDEYLMLNDIIYVVHVHGDNINLLLRYLEILKNIPYIIYTIQIYPKLNHCLRIYGGFTDGDRAAYLAYYFKASSIGLVGFEFNGYVGKYSKPWLSSKSYPTKVKEGKLKWCERLLRLLENVATGDIGVEYY